MKKLSKDYVIGWTKGAFDAYIREHEKGIGVMPTFVPVIKKIKKHILQLIESSAQEPSEAKLEEFVEKWIKIFLALSELTNCGEIIAQQAPKLIPDMLKEYDSLREGKEAG